MRRSPRCPADLRTMSSPGRAPGAPPRPRVQHATGRPHRTRAAQLTGVDGEFHRHQCDRCGTRTDQRPRRQGRVRALSCFDAVPPESPGTRRPGGRNRCPDEAGTGAHPVRRRRPSPARGAPQPGRRSAADVHQRHYRSAQGRLTVPRGRTDRAQDHPVFRRVDCQTDGRCLRHGRRNVDGHASAAGQPADLPAVSRQRLSCGFSIEPHAGRQGGTHDALERRAGAATHRTRTGHRLSGGAHHVQGPAAARDARQVQPVQPHQPVDRRTGDAARPPGRHPPGLPGGCHGLPATA